MAIWLYHINPNTEGYYYPWDLAEPRTLLRNRAELVAGNMFRKVEAGDLVCVYIKNVGTNPDGMYVVGRIVTVNSDERTFRWQPDDQLSARTLEAPIQPDVLRNFFGRSYGGAMQRLPTTKIRQWLRLLEDGERYGKRTPAHPKQSKGSGRQPTGFGTTDEISDFIESKRLTAQGFKTNPAMRKAVEQYAVERARHHYQKQGFGGLPQE
jgi:hypothetical protein